MSKISRFHHLCILTAFYFILKAANPEAQYKYSNADEPERPYDIGMINLIYCTAAV